MYFPKGFALFVKDGNYVPFESCVNNYADLDCHLEVRSTWVHLQNQFGYKFIFTPKFNSNGASYDVEVICPLGFTIFGDICAANDLIKTVYEATLMAIKDLTFDMFSVAVSNWEKSKQNNA